MKGDAYFNDEMDVRIMHADDTFTVWDVMTLAGKDKVATYLELQYGDVIKWKEGQTA